MKINVVITDGNRTCNCECDADKTLKELLKRCRFNWKPGTLTAGGVKIPDTMAECELLEFFDFPPHSRNLRLKVTCETPANDPTKRPWVEQSGKKATSKAAADTPHEEKR